MNKRKTSADRNAKQKTPSRRPSASSLHARINTVQQRQLKAERSPSTQQLPLHLDPNDSSKMVNRTVDACLPKTRFDPQDKCRELRSCSSPRLKSFPAEKINKLNNSPSFSLDPIGAIIVQQNPRETGTLFVAAPSNQPGYGDNGGQGDAAAATQSSRHHQNMHATGQQVAVSGQTHPRSECMLPQQVPNSQSHRPFVPYALRDHSPRKEAASSHGHITATSQPLIQQIPSNSGSAIDQERRKTEEGVNVVECPDYEKQPVGGRNATFYRQMVSAKPQEQMPQLQWNSNHQSHPYVQNNYLTPNHAPPYALPRHPQQIYQQLQQNMAQQQQMQRRAMNSQMQMMNSRQQVQGNQVATNYNEQQFRGPFPEQGMSPPQEAAAHRMKNPRTPVPHYSTHQRDLEYTMNPQNGWTKNNRDAIERSNVAAPLRFDLQNQQQFASPYRPEQPTYQYQQLYRNPGQGMVMNQNQQNHSGFNPAINTQQPSMTQRQDNQDVGQNSKKKPLKFTASMIRDQEKLLATMNQQGVPLETMKRQFDALMNEQRRQLEYMEEIKKQDETTEVKRPQPIARRRKQMDEKPEWMIHLTPPRLSYSELEKLHEERRQKERQAQHLEQVQQAQQLQLLSQPQTNETSNQHIPLQPAHQQHPSFWQQPAAWPQRHGAPQHRSNAYAQFATIPNNVNTSQQSAKQVPNPPAMNYQYYQQQQNVPLYRYAQHPYQQQQHHQQQQQVNNAQYQQYQQIYQDNSQHNQGHYVMQQNQQNRQPTEPSSLLKMRTYKEVIRPQRRNNGLQDPNEARKQLKQLEASVEEKKGLEYLANLASKKVSVKLNGTQERNEMEDEWRERLLMSSHQPSLKRVAVNGLENERNPDNPPPMRLTNLKRMEQEQSREYPRQKQYSSPNCYNVQAERENGTVAVDRQAFFAQQQQLQGQNSVGVIPYNDKNPLTARDNVMPYRFEGTYPQHYQQMQQYYQNAWNFGRKSGEGDVGSTEKHNMQSKGNFDRAGGDACANMNAAMEGQIPENKMTFQGMHLSQPDIHEARTIGGVKYLARKPIYIPNTQFLPPETLIAGRHLQPPMMLY